MKNRLSTNLEYKIAGFNRSSVNAGSSYYIDLQEFLRYFPRNLGFNFLPGDITHIPELPSIQKTRPIAGDKENAVLFKLNKNRHFNFVKDNKKYTHKQARLFWRGAVHPPQKNRATLLQAYFSHPFCNLGATNKNIQQKNWLKNYVPIYKQLDYKFILALEGNDVATNLKWVMSSNSIAVMPKPRFESWFMEGSLVPDFHYICIKDDFSDLIEKLEYFLAHPKEAEAIVSQANKHVEQFLDKKQEKIISLLVLEKYFRQTGQFAC